MSDPQAAPPHDDHRHDDRAPATGRVFEHRTLLRHPREAVWRWLTNPGALTRLTPPYAGRVIAEPEVGLPVGAQAVLELDAPGSAGLFASAAHGAATGLLPSAVASRVPAPISRALTPRLTWRARHTALEPGRGFTDEMVSGPVASWTHRHTLQDAAPGEADAADGSRGTVVVDEIRYALPAERVLARASRLGASRRAADLFDAELRRQFAYRARVMTDDLDFHSRHGSPVVGGSARRIAVTGASGLIGTQLVALLRSGGHDVVRLTRSASTEPDAAAWDPLRGRVDEDVLSGVDVVVNLAGEPIAGRLSAAHKQAVHDSRVLGTRTLVDAIRRLADAGRPAPDLVNGSAIGYYGADAGAGPAGEGLTEILAPGEDFLAEVCADWEAEAQRAASIRRADGSRVRVAQVRTGIVLDPRGGMLQQVLPLFVAGLGGRLASGGTGPDGTPWMSWIGGEDIVDLFAHAAVDARVSGPHNGVAPRPVTAGEFARTLGRVLRRPAAVPVPGLAPELLLGREGYRTLIAADQKASAAQTEKSGHRFRDTELEPALRHLLGR